MAQNNVHKLCRNCYETMHSNRVVTYAGGKTRNGVCASCGKEAKVRRYNVELDAPPSDAPKPAHKLAAPKPGPDAYSEQVMRSTPVPLLLMVDIRTYRALEGMSERWGRSQSSVVDIVFRRYLSGLKRRRKENTNA